MSVSPRRDDYNLQLGNTVSPRDKICDRQSETGSLISKKMNYRSMVNLNIPSQLQSTEVYTKPISKTKIAEYNNPKNTSDLLEQDVSNEFKEEIEESNKTLGNQPGKSTTEPQSQDSCLDRQTKSPSIPLYLSYKQSDFLSENPIQGSCIYYTQIHFDENLFNHIEYIILKNYYTYTISILVNFDLKWKYILTDYKLMEFADCEEEAEKVVVIPRSKLCLEDIPLDQVTKCRIYITQKTPSFKSFRIGDIQFITDFLKDRFYLDRGKVAIKNDDESRIVLLTNKNDVYNVYSNVLKGKKSVYFKMV